MAKVGEPQKDTFKELMGMEFTVEEYGHVEAEMTVTEDMHQPFGYLHGGVTLALLETVASHGATLMADFSKERPFGIQIQARHWKSGQVGTHMRGVAKLNHVEGTKQFWDVTAYDQEGDVMSDGVFVTKIVSLERLAEKERERAAAKATKQSSNL